MKRIKETELVAVIKRNALSYFFFIQFPDTVEYSKEAFKHLSIFSIYVSMSFSLGFLLMRDPSKTH